MKGSKEFMDQKWTKEKYHIYAQNIVTLTIRSNNISSWIKSTILLQERLEQRMTIVKEIISIASHLLQLGNFFSLVGILMALNSPIICRLKHTFSGLKRHSETLQNLSKLAEPFNQFKNLKEAIKQHTKSIPIPFLGVNLQYYTAADEVPTYIDNQINIYKYKTLFHCISSILAVTTHEIDIQKQEPIYTLLHALPILGDSEIEQLSFRREPRGSQLKDIL